jgi:hypothetical protein
MLRRVSTPYVFVTPHDFEFREALQPHKLRTVLGAMDKRTGGIQKVKYVGLPSSKNMAYKVEPQCNRSVTTV